MNTDKPDAELLPCPFCGSDKVELSQWRDTENPNATWVECTNCGVMQDTFHHDDPNHVKGIASMMWNTRVPDITQLTAEIDRLKQEVEAAKEQLREFAEDVAYQYAYERAGCLTTGGLSTMETAFDILGWDDPHKLEGDSK